MFNLRKRAEASSARPVRRGLAVLASLSAAALVSLASAGTAGALTIPSNVTYPASTANNLLIGSGSATTYNMMQSLDLLFNQTPGCDITSGSITGGPTKHLQQLNYQCEKTKSTGKVLEQVAGNSSYLDNPINDISVQEPPMGSSNGIAALEIGRNQTNTGVGTYLGNTSDCTKTPPATKYNCASKQFVSKINYARSSRTLSTSKDVKGLNFVAYAQDGVAPFFFSEFGGSSTPQAKVASDLSGTTLFRIWNGTIFDWGQLGAATSYPIYVYSAQEGSGTQATFKTYLDEQAASSAHPGLDPSTALNDVNCTDPVKPGTTVTKTSGTTIGTFTVKTGSKIVPRTIEHTDGGTTSCKGPTVIFENEDASILKNDTAKTESARAKSWTTEQLTPAGVSPVGGGIFFYSFGKYTEQCAGLKDTVSYLDGSETTVANYKAGTHCGSVPLPTGDKVTLSDVNGIALNPQTVVTHTWPIDRYLNNVYSNGHNPNIPAATAATLNYVSEIGFVCKTQTVTGKAGNKPKNTFTKPFAGSKDITDPASGLWYHDEIFNTIIANGFIPLDVTASTTYASITDGTPQLEDVHASQTAYSLLSTAPGGETYLMTGTNKSITKKADPIGYCLVHSTTTAGATNS